MADDEFLADLYDRIATITATADVIAAGTASLGSDRDTTAARSKLAADRRSMNAILSDTDDFLNQQRGVFVSAPPDQRKKIEAAASKFYKLKAAIVKQLIPGSQERERRIRLGVRENHDERRPLLDVDTPDTDQQVQEQVARLKQYDYSALETEAAIQQEKYHEIQELTSALREMHSAFKDFAELTHEQHEDVKAVAINVGAAATRIETGVDNLHTVRDSTSSLSFS